MPQHRICDEALYNAQHIRRDRGGAVLQLSPFCRKIISLAQHITAGAGKSVAWLTALMAAVTAAIVLLRLVFASGSLGAQESLTYMHALVIMLASAYTLQEDAHVRVDIFYRRFSACQRAWVNLLGTTLFLLPFAVFTVFICWDYVAASWRIREASVDAQGIPAVFLLKTLLLVNGVLLGLQALAELGKHLNSVIYSDVEGEGCD